MKEKNNLAVWIKHIKLSAITSFASNESGVAALTWTADRPVPFVKATLQGGTTSNKDVRGKSWTTKYGATLKSEVKDFEPGIILIKLQSGETLIIGDQEFPVTILMDESLTQKTIEISHEGWHKPFILAI